MAEIDANANVDPIEKNMTTAKERFGHALGGVGQNTIYALWSGFITAFYTDAFGMKPSVMATIFLVARVWDAFNDPIMGMVADRGKSRHGKFRVWLLRMPPVVATLLVLNFTVPNFGTTGNIIYAFVTYILMGMAFTSVDIPYWSLPAAMTSNPDERTKIFTTSTIGANIGTTVGNAMIPILLVAFGGTDNPRAYFLTALIYGIIGAVLYLTSFGLVREHVKAPQEKFSFKLAMKSLYTNKPLMAIMVANLVINLAFIMKMSINYYYTTYTLGNVQLMSIMSLVTLPAIITGTAITPLISKKLGKKNSLIALMVTNLIVSSIFFLVGYDNIVLVIIMSALQILCVGSAMVLINSMTADTIEYGEWKTGQRNEGVITSTRTLITKLASSLVGVLVAVVLTVTGYVANVEQSVFTKDAFHFAVSMLPGIVMMIGVIPMFFYPLTEDRYAEITTELRKRREEKE